ncbi:MAG: hypothetical protein V1664_00900 [Candidatus Uhrbacteria bacterium]
MRHKINKFFRVFFPQQNPVDIKKEYKLPESINFSLRLTQDGWFVLTMPDHPGLVTEAENSKQLIEMVNDAILTYYDVPRRGAGIVYDRLNIEDTVLNYYDFSKVDTIHDYLNIGDTVRQYQGQLQTQKA